jgi:hypothetical protein
MHGSSKTAGSAEAHPSGQKSATFPVKEQTDASIWVSNDDLGVERRRSARHGPRRDSIGSRGTA